MTLITLLWNDSELAGHTYLILPLALETLIFTAYTRLNTSLVWFVMVLV